MAQWNEDLTMNMPISGYDKGDACTTHAAVTPDGKFWVTWLEWGEGMNGNIKAQLLDRDGTPLLAENGIYVTDQVTATWHTDYGMAVTPNGDLIVCHSDSRNDSDRQSFDPYVYRINQDGDQLWGLEGVLLPTTEHFGGRPSVAVTKQGSIFVAYHDTQEITGSYVLMKMNDDGTMAWDTPIDTHGWQGTLMAADDDCFYMTVLSGGLLLYKVDSLGDYEWGPITICDKAINGYQYYPAYPDGQGGVFVPYYYSVDMSTTNCGMQHVTAEGETTMGLQGVDIIANWGHNAVPGLALNGNREEVMTYWFNDMGAGEESKNMYVMKFDYNGNELWPERLRRTDMHISPASGTMLDDGSAVLFYGEYTGNITMRLIAEKRDPDGNILWRTQLGQEANISKPTAFYDNTDAYYFWNDSRNSAVASSSMAWGCVFGQYLNLGTGTGSSSGVEVVEANAPSFNGNTLTYTAQGQGAVEVFDIAGARIAEYALSDGYNNIDMNLTNGIYVLRVIDEAGVKTLKVTK